ncbi:hypothetical protein ONS95_006744 [Cadophora gregata]|uniref:uncharacterized protein n=1 Tax=Cadophora gregata TaxID=51156 RepID=UPI0026DBE54F|nr:uncharacterized protein ONS95_006744 [Cadophora gregata]KAK0101580.1 hypothetical protein ONS95_006744 [Cadophora gregata]KAK0106407.1 hypothetical protein ONS96_004038 [Cadophora gregata f. sp. sojae]
MTPQKWTITERDIPPIETLCELLGLKGVPDEQTVDFMGATWEFLHSYEFLDGMDSEKLLDWNMPTISIELREMATAFLSDQKCGERYWGGGRTWSADVLQYPEDEDRIIELLMQLFWRQNKQTFDLADRGDQAGHPSRDHIAGINEDIQRRRPTSRSSTIRNEAPFAQTSHHNREGKLVSKPSPSGGNVLAENADAFDGPEDLDADIRDAMEYLSRDDHVLVPCRPETPPSEVNTRKRKAPTSDGPRRSLRKRNTVQYNVGNESSSRSSDGSSRESLEPSIERHEDSSQDSVVEIICPGDTVATRNMTSEMFHALPSIIISQKAPRTSTSVPTAKGTKTSIPNERMPGPSCSPNAKGRGKTMSRSADTPSTNSPAPGRKVLKLKMPLQMPSIKAVSKPLGKKVPAARRLQTPPTRATGNIIRGSFASPGGNITSLHHSPPLSPTIEPFHPPPLTPAARSMPTPTSLPRPPAADIVPVSMSTFEFSAPEVRIWVVEFSPKCSEEWLQGVRLAGISLWNFLTSIAELLGRSVDDIQKIKMTLEMPMLNTKITVKKGQEDVWEDAKNIFAERLSLQGGDGRLDTCRISVEPVWEERKVDVWEDVDDGEGGDGLYDA